MKPKYFFLLCLSFYILNSTFSIATVRYVSKTGSSTPPYTSWQTAADSIQKCINICSFGDTVYVANGNYKELIVMVPGLSLIGAGMDSCIIDTRNLAYDGFHSVEVVDNCVFKGFYVSISFNTDMGYGINGTGNCLITLNKVSNGISGIGATENSFIYNNLLLGNRYGVNVESLNSKIRKNIIYMNYSGGAGIRVDDSFVNTAPIVDSNYIEINEGLYGIKVAFGTKPTITSNTILLKNADANGILTGFASDTTKVFNNVIIAKSGRQGIEYFDYVPLLIYNNYVTGNFDDNFDEVFAIYVSNNAILKNNVVTNTERGIKKASNSNAVIQYNNSWNNGINYGNFIPDSSNLSVDPMVVNDDTTRGDLDFHLQKYSPLVDVGDPNILDKDNSRSDVGLYGGLYGEEYKYLDLAPRAPINFTVIVDTNYITLNWNKNTEADTSFYKVYRDTVVNFLIDSTKLISSQTDTFFVQTNPHNVTKYVYKLTCVDKQGNESEPSEEKVVNITGIELYPQLITDYQLYQNYPNPFNPSTTISYRLKERGYVKLYVYDIKGELVSTLVNKTQDAGFYEVEFSSSSIQNEASRIQTLASGIYIYQLMVKSERDIPVFTDIKKMIYLK